MTWTHSAMSSYGRVINNMPQLSIEKHIRWAGILVCAGLAIQLMTLNATHLLAFMAFLLIGCPLMGAGVLLYLYSLVAKGPQQEFPARTPSSHQ